MFQIGLSELRAGPAAEGGGRRPALFSLSEEKKLMRRVAIAAAVLAALTAAACEKSNNPPTPVEPTSPAQVSAIKGAPTSLTLRQDSVYQLSLDVTNASGQAIPIPDITYSSSDKTVATVDESGAITAVGAGTATITATYSAYYLANPLSVTVPVTVTSRPIASFAVQPTDTTIYSDQTFTISTLALGTGGAADTISARPVSFASSDTTIATVGDDGTVTPVATGSVTITSTIACGKGCTDKSATTTVTIVNRPVETVTVSPDQLNLAVGDSQPLTVTLKAANGSTLTGRTITYQSLQPSIATVDSKGVVTAVASGTATIKVTSEGKSGYALVVVQ